MKGKHIVFFVSSFNVGGVERAFVNLANSFVENGHKVDFVVSRNIGNLHAELDIRINVIDLNAKKLRHSFFSLYKYIKSSSADCLIAGPTYPNIVALVANMLAFNKMKIIVSQHSYQDLEMQKLGLTGKIAPFLVQFLYNKSYKVVAVSEGVKDYLISDCKVQEKKIQTIYNAVINNSFFKKSEEEIPEAIANKLLGKRYIIAVGRLEAVKNYSFMLQSFVQLRTQGFDYDLVILGEGADRDMIEKKINELRLNNIIHLFGALANPFPIIKKAKLFIHTSFSEAMPLVYVESLALKVPVVTITNKGALEILGNIKSKYIVNSHNQEEFTSAIYKMLRLKFLEEDFVELKQFHSDEIMKSYLMLID
ncbi:glycosyltransferase [Flavobacterium sp. MMLR14_040]|uniref:glycosyltransferase n=1 Tax=Flavobacterium sp. MMLR14_040 TaxID=3093843 RepID=UPI0029907300|nr:glycosyltransferase [Flavobacterium sp. MMLR14_040]MDW8849262.1 glycosyltransferase [Flavobacterium sp. MMLR14_040]